MQIGKLMPALLLAALACGGAPALSGAAQVRLSEQKAVYDLELQEATHRSGLVSVRGRIVLSMSGGGCSGWTNETRMVNDYFFRRRGHRMIDSPEGVVKVSFSSPVERTTTLPAGTLFPTQATRRIIATATNGGKALRFHVYEGFENGRARLVSVIIGRQINTRFPTCGRGPYPWPTIPGMTERRARSGRISACPNTRSPSSSTRTAYSSIPSCVMTTSLCGAGL